MKCVKCGRFCKNVEATINGLEDIIKVEGDCSRCGHVDLTKGVWDYDMFERKDTP